MPTMMQRFYRTKIVWTEKAVNPIRNASKSRRADAGGEDAGRGNIFLYRQGGKPHPRFQVLSHNRRAKDRPSLLGKGPGVALNTDAVKLESRMRAKERERSQESRPVGTSAA